MDEWKKYIYIYIKATPRLRVLIGNFLIISHDAK
jgi:hypothetical protein